MNFTKIIIFIFFILFIFSIPVSAESFTNGGFETGDLTGWSYSSNDPSHLFQQVGSYARTGDYGLRMWGADSGGTDSSYIKQTFSSASFSKIYFSYKLDNVDNGMFRILVHSTTSGSHWSGFYTADTGNWIDTSFNCGAISNIDYVKFYGGPQNNYVPYEFNLYVDNIGTEYTSPITLMEFTNEPIKVGTYAHLEVNLDDYWDTHVYEHYYLSYDYYYKNMTDYTVINYNERELYSKNTINMIPTYLPYFNQTGGCEIKASILYTYRDPVYNEVELGGIGYYISTVLVNSTYTPPEEPEEPEEPEIPDSEIEPNPVDDYPIPPNQPNGTNANQSINASWTTEYYNTVNNTVSGLCSPIYNFTGWTLSPINSLNSSIGEFNYYMNESFIQTSEDSSILYESINTIYGAIHPKIRNVITYYLIWLVLLIILKKD